MNRDTQELPTANNHLRILQINLNKSAGAHYKLLNINLHNEWDIVLMQEPHRNFFKHISTPRGFRQVYPSTEVRKNGVVRSGIWINEQLSTNTWKAIDIKGTADVTAVQIHGAFGKLTIFNIYNDCNNDDSIKAVNDYIETHSKKNIATSCGRATSTDTTPNGTTTTTNAYLPKRI